MTRPLPAVPLPVGLADLWTATLAGDEALRTLEDECRRYHGAQACFALSSARAGLWISLRVLRKLHPHRSTVLLPAYTCPTVGRAVLAAGLEGLCVDISPEDFNLDAAAVARLADSNILAVVAAHMFGTPCDLAALTSICHAIGATLIEDAAQASGARFAGQLVGTFGGLAVLSLGRSKNLRGHKGGLVVVNDPQLVELIAVEVNKLPQPNRLDLRGLTQQAAICLLSTPWLWNAVKRVPALHVGAEDQRFDEWPSRLRPWQAALGLRALERLNAYNALRAHWGKLAEDRLRKLPWLHLQIKHPPRESAYVRLALRIRGTRELRNTLEAHLQKRGIDARAFYTRPIYGYNWWSSVKRQDRCPHAEALVHQNLTLPLFYGACEADIEFMVDELQRAYTSYS
ncbi:MAG: DegT/DnrJ/EryC1/StrS family aminotransferase [Candidatus Zipacnadales bacterium]